MHVRVTGLLLLFTAAACGTDVGQGGVTVRDSAGIRIVQNPAPAANGEVRWRADATPSLTIGAIDGEAAYQLDGVRSVLRLPDGRLLIAQGAELRFFDDAGRHLHTAGGEGDGPGEFRRLRSVRTCGSGLIAEDLQIPRVSRLNADGAFRESAEAPPMDRGSLPPVAGCFGTELVYSLRKPADVAPGARVLRRDTSVLVRFGTGGTRDTLIRIPRLETFDGLTRPFGRTALYTLTDSNIHVADTSACEVRSYNLRGRLQRIIRCGAVGQPVDATDVDSIRARYISGVPPSLLEQEILPRLDAVPFPDTKPVLSALRVDTAGHLWLRPYAQPEEGSVRWWVFDPDGAFAGVAETPAGLTVHAIDTAAVLGVWRDEMDVEYVRAYPLFKR
ncbi:MAG: hypothetical protein WEB88_17745 [Gemmatimonadota bacterium]